MYKLDHPIGSSILPSFNDLNINEMGLMKDGDVIVDVEGNSGSNVSVFKSLYFYSC